MPITYIRSEKIPHLREVFSWHIAKPKTSAEQQWEPICSNRIDTTRGIEVRTTVPKYNYRCMSCFVDIN